jgi:uncharacterized protein (TIGR02646 family)
VKRVKSSQGEPDVLMAFRNSNPSATWAQFKNEPGNEAVFDALALAQGFICAYCEIRIDRSNTGQVEHYEPKSTSAVGRNLHLAYDNMLACCDGGTIRWRPDRSLAPISQTMHCGQLKGAASPTGHSLDPRSIPVSPCLWGTTSRGELFVDREACLAAQVDPDLAESTLRFLGLNSRILVRLRSALLEQLERELESDEPRQVVNLLLPDRRGELSQFWSTIRAWAGAEIEQWIAENVHLIPGLA